MERRQYCATKADSADSAAPPKLGGVCVARGLGGCHQPVAPWRTTARIRVSDHMPNYAGTQLSAHRQQRPTPFESRQIAPSDRPYSRALACFFAVVFASVLARCRGQHPPRHQCSPLLLRLLSPMLGASRQCMAYVCRQQHVGSVAGLCPVACVAGC